MLLLLLMMMMRMTMLLLLLLLLLLSVNWHNGVMAMPSSMFSMFCTRLLKS